jgi:hypothetical protein
MYSDIKLPFAKVVSTSQIVSPEEVDRGVACNCICIFCDVPMVAKKGEVNRHHFSHQAKFVNDDHLCPASIERCLFWMARRVFQENTQFITPDYNLYLSDFETGMQSEHQITVSKRIVYDSVQFLDHTPLEKYDEVLLIIGSHKLIVALYFGEFRPVITGQSRIQINLAPLVASLDREKKNFHETMSNYLISAIDNKSWDYHPNENVVRLEFAEQVRVEKQVMIERLVQHQKYEAEKKAISQMRNQNPQSNRDHFREQCDVRIKELVAIAKALVDQGEMSGRHCLVCHVMNKQDATHCYYCQQTHFEYITLDEAYMAHLFFKYRSNGYGAESLRVLAML